MKLGVHLAAAILVWSLGIIVAGTGFSVYYVTRGVYEKIKEPAILIDSFYPETFIHAPGGPVKFILTAKRIHECPSVIVSFWLDEAGAAVVRLPLTTGGYTDEGPEEYTIPVEVPAPSVNTLTGLPLPSGRYSYKSVNAPLCDHLLPTSTPPAAICLVVPGQPLPECAGELDVAQ